MPLIPTTRLAQLACLGAALALPAKAGTLYRCTEANGKITYSDTTCVANANAGAEAAIAFPKAPPRPVGTIARAPAKAQPKRRTASMALFYDPANAPREHPVGQMETLIQQAVAAWTSGCAVQLDYMGTAPHVAQGSAEHVSIRWSADLMRARHPANAAAGIGGTGSMETGVALNQRVSDASLAHILVHEIGHVLGIAHIHEDGNSVMSYLPDGDLTNNLQPSAADYLACNRAMKKRFSLDTALPREQAGPRMTDAEALERHFKRK